MTLLEVAKKHSAGIRLFSLVFMTLYLELALIRFTAAEVLYLGYFSNFVLIAVFLGIGVGFLMARRKTELFDYLPQAVLVLVGYVLVTRIDVTALRDSLGQLFFGHQASALAIPLELSLTLIFGLTAFSFACIAQATARCFEHYRPLVAYSLDIGGSLAGIAVFTLHSYLGGTPVQWFSVVLVLVAVLSWHRSRFNALVVGAGIILLVIAGQPGVRLPVQGYAQERHRVRLEPHGYHDRSSAGVHVIGPGLPDPGLRGGRALRGDRSLGVRIRRPATAIEGSGGGIYLKPARPHSSRKPFRRRSSTGARSSGFDRSSTLGIRMAAPLTSSLVSAPSSLSSVAYAMLLEMPRVVNP